MYTKLIGQNIEKWPKAYCTCNLEAVRNWFITATFWRGGISLYPSFTSKSHAFTEPNTVAGNNGYQWKLVYR